MHAEEIFCFRAHELTNRLSENYARFADTFGPDRVFVVADHTVSTVEWPASFNVIELTKQRLDALGLYRDHPRLGWLCGDYSYYVARDAIGFRTLWLMDADLYFQFGALCTTSSTCSADRRRTSSGSAFASTATRGPGTPGWQHSAMPTATGCSSR